MIARNKAATGALALALAAASGLFAASWPALGQQQKAPESILPPGFEEPAPTPPPTPDTAPTPPTPLAEAPPIEALNEAELGDAGDTLVEAPDPAELARYETPDFARRSLAVTGIVGPDQDGLAGDAFGNAEGHYLETLMSRLDAPIASRWLSIWLRRALASRLATPTGLNGADFAAERGWLLVRMGEPIVARAVVQSVDTGNFTPKLYEAALQALLASADPGGLCPLVPGAQSVSADPAWTLAGAFCAGLAGDPEAASEAIGTARRRGVARGVDLLLAEKVLGAGAQGRQAVTIEWDGVDRLTAWRYGLATATGVTIPDRLRATAHPRLQLWSALAPTLDARARLAFADRAATQGVYSNAALVDLYADLEQADDPTAADVGIARDLRTAYIEADPSVRLAAMRQLWDGAPTAEGRYARLILTARAATRLPPDSGTADALIDDVIASMLSVGLDKPALRWRGLAVPGSRGWAMLALVDPAAAPLSRSNVAALRARPGHSAAPATAMFFAALAAFDRVAPNDIAKLAETLKVNLAVDNGWTRAIDRAARQGQPGTVLLLAGIGMQTSDWRGVSPAALYRIIVALRRVGLDDAARMIAVEALTRL